MSPLPSNAVRFQTSGPTEGFLGVERSATGRRWVGRLDGQGRNLATAIAQREGVSEVVARVMAARGATLENARSFLAPRLRNLLPDPDVLTGMGDAVERLAHAVERREKIAIFGDYDVDGAASAALVERVLAALGCETEIYVPDRLTEGYGPNDAAIRELIGRGAQLIVTVDCGTASHGPIETARARGVDCVVIDHHQTGPDLPAATALVNPNRQDDLSDLGELCATGVAFMVMVGLRRRLARSDFPDLLGLLDLVALATVCDMVPLTALNRAFVTTGLNVMNAERNCGLRALRMSSRLGLPVDAGDLGFRLGPRINAGGRVGDAALGARLLTTANDGLAHEIAGQLEGHNRERQAIEADVLASALAEAESELGAGEGPAAIVTGREGWHPGVVGLVASRLKERFGRPAFAIGFDASGRGTGSGRSVPSVDLGRLVREAVAEGLLDRGGGHAMAAGITIRRERVGAFRAFVEERTRRTFDPSVVPELSIDAALSPSGATRDLIEALDSVGPYGVGHPKPVVALPEARLVDVRVVGRNHLALRLAGADGTGLRGIAFRAADAPLGTFLQSRQGESVHLAGTLERDDYRGRSGVSLRVDDASSPN